MAELLVDVADHFYGPTQDAPSAPAASDPRDMSVAWYGPEKKPDGDPSQPVTKPVAKPAVDVKKPAEAQPVKSDTAAPVVPEKYDLKLPENTIVDQPMMTEFTAWAKQNKFTAEQAQKAADLHLKSVEAIERQREQTLEDQKQTWSDEIVADRELGGDRLDATMAATKATFTKLVAQTPGINAKRLSDDLAKSGLATHPDIIRLFHTIGRKLK